MSKSYSNAHKNGFTPHNLPAGLTVAGLIELAEDRMDAGLISREVQSLYDLAETMGDEWGWEGPYQDRSGRLEIIPVHTWICTDTEVGWNLHVFDNHVYFVTYQSGRKSRLNGYIVDADRYAEAERYRESLRPVTDEEPKFQTIGLDDLLCDPEDNAFDLPQGLSWSYDSERTVAGAGSRDRVQMRHGVISGRPSVEYPKFAAAVQAECDAKGVPFCRFAMRAY